MEKGKSKKKNFTWYLVMTGVLVAAVTLAGISVFGVYMNRFRQMADTNQYDKYYIMIAGDTNSSLWQSVYEGAFEAGLQENSYVDLLNGFFDSSYSREDLMRIAIASEVDGIIVGADESDEMTELINEASAQGIPVVTLYSDNTQSERCTFVGIGSYDLGREYGREVLEIAQSKYISERPVRVSVLVNAYAQDSGQNILCSGIQETIENEKQEEMELELSLVSIDGTNAFSVEESIRDIFMEEDLPDIIVCLNELNTVCVYQAVVDYNKVGQVNILGYYDSDTIIKAIDRNVIDATISIDTGQMGKYCVDALTEYNAYGNTSQYFIADIELINKDNVALYLDGGDVEE
ncbi:MAG: substrate-binding domain-containing protein [Roseburia sp.]|nr:substrate-binding domain-containing protein [Ruminococcus sp.]MCM1154819.1 substrate-binding domain-containing protein [Roseburia sp.]MCM1241465.1 substrate-binding domain-containing protein [Roseburia sp.]